MINVKEFNEKKEKGLARVLEITNENIIVAFKQYDLEKAKIGELVELPEQVSAQSIEELQNRKTTLLEEISDIDSFLGDNN